MAVAVAVLAATAFNAARVIKYSSSDTRLATQASRDEARAADLRREAARLRATVDPKQVDFASEDARQANELIDRRTFSWTELFNRFETTLPDEVRITQVRPRVDREHGFVLTIMVAAKGVDDVNTFIENLEGSGAFVNVRPVEEHPDEQGLIMSTLEAVYVPSTGKPSVRTGAARR